MFDIYLNFLLILKERRNTSESRRLAINQEIKQFADKMKAQTLQSNEFVFDAVVCYYISGYYVQAQALAGNIVVSDAQIIQRWILQFAAKEFEKLREETSKIIRSDQYKDVFIQTEIDSLGLSTSSTIERIIVRKVAEGLLDMISFIETGEDTKISHANQIYITCQKLLFTASEWKLWWWIECLKIIMDEFVENSLWQALKPMKEDLISSEIVHKYVIANYTTSKITEFWRTQIESLPRINDAERSSFCISVPTSAGKTKAAELAVLRFLLDYWNKPEKKCVYVAPLRKLCQEVEESFSRVFWQFQSGIVSTFYGGHETDFFDDYYVKKARILIVTPEKLDGMLRQFPDLRTQIKLVIADEGHLIGNEDPKYRFLLERLIYLLRKNSKEEEKNSRIILVSGVLPNVEDFAELISGSRKNIVKINWRPVDEPQIGAWGWNGRFFSTTKPDLPAPIAFATNSCASEEKFEEYTVKTAVQCAMMSATFVFSANKTAITKKSFLNLLHCIVDKHQGLFGTFEPLAANLEKHGILIPLLENGIAIHHADLSLEIKREIEKRITNGNIRLLFASPTLAQGVNIPFDTVLIYGLYHQIFPQKKPISDAVFWNVVGRVGRPIARLKKTAAKLEPPKVIFLQNHTTVASYEDQLNIKRSNELIKNRGKYEVVSPFLKFLSEVKRKTNLPVANLVDDLSEKPSLRAVIGESALSKWGEYTLDQYLIRLDQQLFDILQETFSENDLTLEWMQQLAKELVDLFVKASPIHPEELDDIRKVILARLQFIAKHVPKEKRRQDYLLGLPYDDCQKIKENLDNLFRWYKASVGLFNNNHESGSSNLVKLMSFVADLSICKWGRKRRLIQQPTEYGQLSFQLNDEDKITRTQKKLFDDWINGEPTYKLSKQLNNFDEYTETILEKALPWGISAIIRYLNAVSKDNTTTLPIDLEYLPALVKYGVNSKLSCHLAWHRIERTDAVKISNAYKEKFHGIEIENEEAQDFEGDFLESVKSLNLLTDKDLRELNMSEKTIKRISEIQERYKKQINDTEPESPPFENLVLSN